MTTPNPSANMGVTHYCDHCGTVWFSNDGKCHLCRKGEMSQFPSTTSLTGAAGSGEVEIVARAIADRMPLSDGSFLPWDKRHPEEREIYYPIAQVVLATVNRAPMPVEVDDVAKAFAMHARLNDLKERDPRGAIEIPISDVLKVAALSNTKGEDHG